MKHPYLIAIGLCFFWSSAAGQAAPAVFDQLPAPLQFFPRNDQSTALVPVSGHFSAPGYQRVALRLLRNGALNAYQRRELTYENGRATFALTGTIRAELAEYTVEVYGFTTPGDSLLLARREGLLCGDAYLINGQSNANPLGEGYDYYNRTLNRYCRTFGVGDSGNSYAPQDTLWTYPNENSSGVGSWGTELQRSLALRYGVPVCILNGALGGSVLDYHAYRNSNNPTDLGTGYGKLLYRVRKAGLAGHVKALFWRQGEAETSSDPGGQKYPTLFPVLYKNWRLDYPALKQIYVFQTNLLARSFESASQLREYQRQTQDLFPDVTVLTSAGLPGYDGIHYAVAGHLQVAREVFALVAPRFYGSTDTLQIRFPNVRKVFFTDSTRRLVSLVFEEGQKMVWPRDTLFDSQAGAGGTVLSLKTFFLLDKRPVRVDSGWAEGNRVWLRLAEPAAPGRLQYLPASWDNVHLPAFAGPVLKNERGRRAAGFTVALQPVLPPVVGLTASADSARLLRLRWNAGAGKGRYELERAPNPTGPYEILARLDRSTTNYTDRRLPDSTAFWYRIRAVSDSSESPYRLTNARTLAYVRPPVEVQPPAVLRPLVVTATAPPAAEIRVFPNPARERVTVRLANPQPATLRLLDLSGQVLREVQEKTAELTLSLTGLRGGLYLLWVQTERQTALRKLVVE